MVDFYQTDVLEDTIRLPLVFADLHMEPVNAWLLTISRFAL